MNITALISFYKERRKRKILNTLLHESFAKKFAIVGVGSHSLATYYPLLTLMNVPVKYVVTKRSNLGVDASKILRHAIATHDFEKVLSDPEIASIIICTNPLSQFELTKKALLAGKHVLVEKPVCYSSKELAELISIAKTHCIVGLQKRYGQINNLIKKKYKDPAYYAANYLVGAYPEGNPLYEIFIHCLDNVSFLFGSGQLKAIQTIHHRSGIIINAQIQHSNGTRGNIELSTAHDWRNPIDKLTLECDQEQLLIQYPNRVEVRKIEPTFFGLPIGKALRHGMEKKVLYHNNNQIVTIENNILHENGFYKQLLAFIKRTEHPERFGYASSDIRNLVNSYQLLDEIKSRITQTG